MTRDIYSPYDLPIVSEGDIILRPSLWKDTPNIVKWRNKEHIRSNFYYQEDYTVDGHNQWVSNNIEEGKAIQYIICLKDSELPIGSVNIQGIDKTHKRGEYGYYIGEEEYIGKGYASIATRLMLIVAKDVLGLHKLMVRIMPDNLASISMARKVGYEQEAHLREEYYINGKWVDAVLMSVLFE